MFNEPFAALGEWGGKTRHRYPIKFWLQQSINRIYRFIQPTFLFKQVRRSFLEELGIHNNWTVVEMIFREFYTGSDKDLSPEERRILQSLFTTQSYVKREIEYSYTSTVGSVNVSALEGWSNYLEKYREYIVSGTHFTNFAVQVNSFKENKFIEWSGYCISM